MTATHDVRRDFGLPIAPSRGRWRPLGIRDVDITGGFWAERQSLNASTLIAHAHDWMEKVGWIANFTWAVEGTLPEKRRGREFSDSDVYKLMEAMAWEHGRTGSAEMNDRFQSLAQRILPVQEEDGYLNTKFGRPGQEPRYSDFEWGHELYCFGHLIQAAVARARTFGRDGFVEMAIRAADHVCREFGEDGRDAIPGHPEIEVALVELGRLLGDDRYLRQAALFVERRGHGRLADIELGRSYYQDDVPVREATVARGHAVRAMYLAAGAVDAAVELDDVELLEAVKLQVVNTIARRTYATGGMGSRHTGEAFGEDFELPPDRSYSETCAGVAAMMVSQRLLLATGEARFADLIERILYNILATSTAEDGHSYFYANTLYRRSPGSPPEVDVPSPRADSSLRAPWYDVSCCPTNVSRTLASLGSMVATTDDGGVQIHQYLPAQIRAVVDGEPAELEMSTRYPEDGVVRVAVRRAPSSGLRVELRVPEWAGEASLDVGSGPRSVGPGYAVVEAARPGDEIVLTLPMQARWVFPDPRIDTITHQVAVAKGPRIFALESTDLGAEVARAQVDVSAGIVDGAEPSVTIRLTEPAHAEWPYGEAPQEAAGELRQTVLIPYHRWGNRGPATMRVWLPRAE
ncbi:glycoside hydrolase family 127 protein [Tessaracoccus sp. MC1865]|uniref:glycoside hydrolase family 127 protein n=1 Tax=Tessaracoccus sp. MC1865 TaxID=2760310 RepID=UPI001603BB4B|nr:beta-L-arabinofuranosidase domain-containing protein [Tessaracoccus sp. MC1865]MBB1483006.1 glycoside hydrolase family 127 protein [Tessaracoccus sp. MC1865]QTO37558.1 glycoside hydrolase family 127 protein [Tessaracoccus sp. MC1865]